MLSKVVVGSGFFPTLKYVMNEEKQPKVIASNGVRDFNFKLTAEDFQMNRQQIPSINQAVFHGILSFPHTEKHSANMLKTLSEEYLEELGFKDAPYIVVEHKDKKHQHMHVVSSFIDLDGERVDNSWVGLRGKKAAQAITEKHGLIPADKINLGKVNFQALNDREKCKYQAYLLIGNTLKESNSFKDLESKLSIHGITIQYKYRRGTDVIQGISFNIRDKYMFKGSEIDRRLSYANIKQTFSHNESIKSLDKGINNNINQNTSQIHRSNSKTNLSYDSQNDFSHLATSSNNQAYIEEDNKKKKIKKRRPKL